MSIDQTLIALFFATFGGIIPALVWLFFWREEARENPEPKSMIMLAFCGGMAAVFLSLVAENYFYNLSPSILFHGVFFEHALTWLGTIADQNNTTVNKMLLVVVFAPIIEELLKFILAYILVLRTKDDRTPIDPIIYMITTALGFAAIENVLFIIQAAVSAPSASPLIASVLTGDQRFIGAMLLHTIASATIGFCISFNFFDKKLEKTFWVIVGILGAILIHSLFNFFLVISTNSFLVLEVIWIVVIILLFAFEKIKRIRLEKIL